MLVDETNEKGSPRERKVFAKEKETRALLSRVKPIGVNCKSFGWVWLSHLWSEEDAVYKRRPGETEQKQDTWPGDIERPSKVTFNRATYNHRDRKYEL